MIRLFRRFSTAALPFPVSRRTTVHYNLSAAQLVENGLRNDKGTFLTSTGAFAADSGVKTGRSPSDKRIVSGGASEKDVWWGNVNIKISKEGWDANKDRAVDYLGAVKNVYVVDGYAGADEKYRVKIRVICSLAYHALFMRNMLIRPSPKELAEFGKPDFTIYNAGEFHAQKGVHGITSKTSICLNLEQNEAVILGSEYAGEMKKGVFTLMHYLMPKRGALSLHSSANVGEKGDVTLFFGLSGTGKTTLSADARRRLIGDDEHVWTDTGVFNIEGGCYAKCDGLSREKEPEIFDAVRFGSVLENVVMDPNTRVVDYKNLTKTENTRTAYPIDYISNAQIPGVSGHPSNVILLTCDTYGVIPPVSRLSEAQAMYHFISGYTSKMAGTETGVTEPQATFSACFGAPFLVFHPGKYAEMLASQLRKHKANAWLVNTGWTGGSFGSGSRMSLKHTRAIIDAIHNGTLASAPTTKLPVFGFDIPTSCAGVPNAILDPSVAWSDKTKYNETLLKLGGLFVKNFEEYKSGVSKEVIEAGPKAPMAQGKIMAGGG